MTEGSIVGLVLAGGRGRRLGGSKAGLRLPGSVVGEADEAGPSLTAWAVRRLAGVDAVDEVIVAAGAAGNERALEIETGAADGLDAMAPPFRVDDGPGAGPAAGLLGAAQARPGQRLLALACDLPLVSRALLTLLAESTADLAAAAEDERLDSRRANPTCALWTPTALAVLASRVEGGDLRLYPLLRSADLRVEIVDSSRCGDPDELLLNVNTPGDLQRTRELLRRVAGSR